jgi:hypothetical protein
VTPEARYVAALIRAFVARDAATVPVPERLDWERLGGLLRAHGIASTLAEPISADAPRAFREALARQNHEQLRRSAVLGLELRGLLERLAREAVEAVVLKGLALGRSVYPKPSQRVVSDLDLLVRLEALETASRALGQLGYAPAIGERHPLFYRKHHFHLRFQNSGGILVELHWNLSRPADSYQFDLDDFFARTRVIEHDGIALRIPADSDQLLHAACQAMRRGYADLRRVIDAALLVKNGAARAPGLADTARRQGMATATWVLLGLQQALAGSAVPPEVEAALRPAPSIRRSLDSLGLAAHVLDADAQRQDGLRQLLVWLSAPSWQAAWTEIREFLDPGEAQRLDQGLEPGLAPGVWRRGAITCRRAWSVLEIAGFLGFRLARPAVDSTQPGR